MLSSKVAEPPIRAAAVQVRSLLSQDAVLVLPWSQRGFAWSATNILQLINDLEDEIVKEKRGYYCLGQICYAHGEKPGQIELVDGNQRITSILIILSIYRDLCKDAARRAAINTLMWMKPDGPDSEPALRLRVNKEAREFFVSMVLKPGATSIAVEPGSQIVETQRNILDCRDAARDKLAKFSEAELDAMVDYLLDSCWLISVGVETADEAWTIIQTQEDRGVRHHPSDLLKFRLIDEMPIEDRAPAAADWDHWQARLGSDTMLLLLSAIRDLESGRHKAKPLDVDLVLRFKLKEQGLKFIQTQMVPRAQLLDRLRRFEVDAGTSTRDVRRALLTLSWLTQQSWTLPAMRWLEVHGDAHRDTASFFWHLDRLAWMMRIASPDPGQNERRFRRVLADINGAIGGGRSPDSWDSLRIEADLKSGAQKTLRSRTFEEKHVCSTLLRRVSFEYARVLHPDTKDTQLDFGPVNGRSTTTEHILPRSVPVPGSGWAQNFRDREAMRDSAFRLGNLAFLTSEENQKASALDFPAKRVVYGGSTHWLAREALDWEQWTDKVIVDRTEKFIRLLWDVWKL